MERWHRIILVAAGLALMGGFFLPWRSFHGYAEISGYALAFKSYYPVWVRAAIGAAPLIGLALLGAGFSGDKRARAFAMLASVAVLGALGVKAATLLIDSTGAGLWLVVGGAVAVVAAGLAASRKS